MTDKITILNATPAMADVLSGQVARPREIADGESPRAWAAGTVVRDRYGRFLGKILPP